MTLQNIKRHKPLGSLHCLGGITDGEAPVSRITDGVEGAPSLIRFCRKRKGGFDGHPWPYPFCLQNVKKGFRWPPLLRFL